MKLHKWADVKKKYFTAAEIAESKRLARREVLEMNLRSVRELVGKTQVEVARMTKLSQAELSRAERREDHRLSTLRRYVEALGGELEVLAHFGDKWIRLKGV